jgi:hypothetical protein
VGKADRVWARLESRLLPCRLASTAGVERLISLGATALGIGKDGSAVLADPDGNEFRQLSSGESSGAGLQRTGL